MSPKPMLLVGGYGVTGQRIARMLRRRNPDLPLIIAGRTVEKAQAFAADLGNAEGVAVDLSNPGSGLTRTDLSAFGLIAYDQTERAMAFAGRHGIPYLCVSGAAFELCVDTVAGLRAGRGAPVVIANHWYSGAVTIPTLHLAERFERIDSIDVGIVIDRGDGGSGAGPATIADFQRITASCSTTLIREDGRYIWAAADQARGTFKRGDGVELDGAGSVSCDVLSIGAATEADNIRVLEAWGESTSRAAGGPPCDEVCIRIRGRGKDGSALSAERMMSCPRDPASFTVLSVAILLERMAGLDGGAPMSPGLYMAEHAVSPAFFVGRLKEEGVAFSGD